MTVVREANFLYLLLGLLALLLAGPLSYEILGNAGGVLFSAALAAMMLIGVWSLQESRLWFWVGIGLVIAAGLAALGEAYLASPGVRAAGLLIALAFFLLTLAFAADQLIGSSQINGNRLIGAMCVFLLLGLTMATCNLMIDLLMPGSFRGLADSADRSRTSLELVYYTFVTMTTLGYGDIAPVRPLARAIAYITAVVGQFYLTILVAILIGMYLRRAE